MNIFSRTFSPSVAKAVLRLTTLFWFLFASGLAFADLPITVLSSFTGTNGNAPTGGVTLDISGNLYGTTSQGGTNNLGTVYEIVKGSSAITVLGAFDGKNGANPFSSVTFDSSGNLYGTTSGGGESDKGTVYEIAKGSLVITVVSSFNGKNGANPPSGSGVAFDGSGNLYGTTNSGGVSSKGTVYEIAKGSYTIMTLASFDGTNGANPFGGVTLDRRGNLYGTTNKGGASSYGTIYEIVKGSRAITVLGSFNGKNGAASFSGVTLDSGGNLYGTTAYGGANNCGVVYEVAKGSRTITVLGCFNGKNGANPHGEVTLDTGGNLFGAASQGGTNNRGTVYEIAKGSRAITIVGFFNGKNGATPFSSITLDRRGSLYGTTFSGGGNNSGVIYEITGAAKPEQVKPSR